MSGYITGSLAYEGFNPGGPTDGIHQEFPFDWICAPDATAATDWYVPFYITPAQAMEWFRRFRALQPDFTLSYSTFTWNRNPALIRKTGALTLTDELELETPGILSTDTYTTPEDGPFLYTATQSDPGWNGPGSTSEFTLSVELFKKQRLVVDGLDVDVPHMIWQTDGALIMPSIRVSGSLLVTTPSTELSWFFSTENISAPAYVDSVEIFPSHGGASVDLNFSSATDTPDAFGLSINPGVFWSHNGKWDTATGARL